ncbi:MAG: hypothetical protein ABJF04_18180 [Reichenbachiella sp.]|uniref:hypothetical protein n=1 Tax=Reichenbachiella sp. TaxID=2184521 RepID=UPI003264D7F4
MKIYSLLLITVLAIYSCGYDEQNIAEDLYYLAEETNPSQYFEISPDSDTVLIGSLGTKIYIKANSLTFDDGELTSSEVTLKLKEVYSKADMILNGLTTTSDDNLLESSGMINITASSEGRNLELNVEYPIRIQFQKKSERSMMRTYLGNLDSTRMNWILDTNNVYDTIKYSTRVEMIIHLDVPEDVVTVMDVLYGLVGLDTIEIKRTPVFDNQDSTFYYQPFYEIHATSLNWINCDYFNESKNNTNVLVKKIENTKTLNFLVFKDINSVMGPWDYDENNIMFRNVPHGSQVTIVSIGKKDADYLLATKDIIAGQTNQEIGLDYEKHSLEEIDKKIKSSF